MDDITVWIIIGVFEILCLVIAIALASRRNWRAGISEDPEENPIEHYTEARDELTDEVLKPEPEDEEDSSSDSPFGGIATAVISLGVVCMVGFLVLSNVMSAVNQQMNTTGWNNSGVSPTLINTVWSLFPIIAIIGMVFVILNVFGLTSSFDDDKPKKKRKPKPGVDHYTKSRDKLTMKSKQNDAEKRVARKMQSNTESQTTASMTGTATTLFNTLGKK